MSFRKTIRAVGAALLIAAAMIWMSSVVGSKDAETVDVSAAPTPTVILIAEGMGAAADGYQGIEPNVTEDNIPDRAGFTYYPEVSLDRVMQDFIFVEAGEAAVDYELVLAIIIHESHCDPDAISATNDYGLMQINRVNHEWLAEEYGLTNMLDPRQNIIAGITILSQLSKYDDGTSAGLHKVLMAYNMGPTGAAKAWEAGIYSTEYSKATLQIRDDLLGGKYGKEEA